MRISLLPILAALALILLLFWTLMRDTGVEPPPPTPPVRGATTPPEEPTTPPRSPAATKPGYRLAGTVVGDVRYAVIEQPDGTNDLYRPGESVPGLGRLVDLGADRATFEGSDGRIELQLAPASTPTVTPSPAEEPTSEEATETTEPSGLDLTPPATSPSGETDQSAS